MGPERVSLWAIDDPAAIQTISEVLGPATLYIADGHHRYETAVAYWEECNGTTGDDRAHVLSYCSAASDRNLYILPTHRVVRSGATPVQTIDSVMQQVGQSWTSQRYSLLEEALKASDEEAGASRHSFVVITRDGFATVSRDRRRTSSPRSQLDVTVLHEELLPVLGVPTDAPNRGLLAYTRQQDEAVADVRSGSAALGFLLHPATMREIMAVADARETMPQKSTYFYPKVPTGLVISRL